MMVTAVILALWRLRQNFAFKFSLGYMVNHQLKKKKIKKRMCDSKYSKRM